MEDQMVMWMGLLNLDHNQEFANDYVEGKNGAQCSHSLKDCRFKGTKSCADAAKEVTLFLLPFSQHVHQIFEVKNCIVEQLIQLDQSFSATAPERFIDFINA